MTSGNWMNKDGLYLEFGTTKPTNEIAGEYKTYGEMREAYIELDLTTLTTSDAIISNTYKFPTGCRIFEVIVETHTGATSTGSSTLDIGLIQEDRSTTISATGLVAGLAKASYDTAGKKTTMNVGSTSAGALLGTATTAVGYLTAKANVAVFTAGLVRILVRFYGFGTITQ